MSTGERTARVRVRDDDELRTIRITGADRPAPTPAILEKWQTSLNLLVHIVGVPASLVTRVEEEELCALLVSDNADNPIRAGERYPLATGMYCEYVLGTDSSLQVVDAANDDVWRGNPDMVQGLGDYVGEPLHWPDGSFFGTLCVLDRARILNEDTALIVGEFASAMEMDLANLCLMQEQSEKADTYAKSMEALLRHTPGGIFSYAEDDGRFSYISDNMLSLLGYTEEEFMEKFDSCFFQMIWHEDRERVLHEIEEQIAIDPFDVCEYRIEKKDGTLVWVRDEGHIVADDDGRRWYYVVIIDITDRVEQQRLDQERYRQSLQTMLVANPNAICTFTLNLTADTCGEGHGVSPNIMSQLSSDTARGLFENIAKLAVTDEGCSRVRESLDREKLLEAYGLGERSRSVDYRRRDDEGKRFWVRTIISMLENPETGDIEAVIYSMDISQEVHQEELFKVLTDREFDVVSLLHLDTDEIEFLNLSPKLLPKYHQALGEHGKLYDYDAVRGLMVASWIAEEDRDYYLESTLSSALKQELDRKGHCELILRGHYTGHPDEYMCRKLQHYYLNDEENLVLIIQTDVTETYLLRQQETELARAEAEHARDIMDSISGGIAVLRMRDSEHLTLDYVNLQLCRLLGYIKPDGDATEGARARERFMDAFSDDGFRGIHADDVGTVRKVFRDNFASSFFTVGPYRVCDMDGNDVWLFEEVTLREITPQGRIFYATYRDVSEEVRLRAELEHELEQEKTLRAQADAANMAKSEFLSRMSHDIRTPINAITGMIAFAEEDVDDPEKLRDELSKIDHSAKRLLSLINDVLDISRTESGKIELDYQPYFCEEYVAGVRSVFEPICAQKGITFVMTSDNDIDAAALVDRVRIDQITTNIISNAVKYTPPGGTITFSPTGRSLPGGMVECCLEVRDTGIGMSREYLEEMFEPFSQETDNPLRPQHVQGTGLGLSIVKRLVDLMGGTIAVESELGKGTTVSVRFELERASAEQIECYERGSCLSALADRRDLHGKALLAEDNKLNAEISVRLLESFGLEADVAENGKQALEMFSDSRPGEYDVIVMDIQMPFMNGYGATRAIRTLERDDAKAVPIIAMTADAFSEDVQRCLDAGMDAHIAKPINPQVLYDTLSRYL